MHWMQWVREQPGSIWTAVPPRWFIKSNKSLAGWLMRRDGCLQAVYVAVPAIVSLFAPGAVAKVVTGGLDYTATTFAGCSRPAGAARLTGVLHYFTRGPDGIF